MFWLWRLWEHLLVHIDSRYSVSHRRLSAGNGERAIDPLGRVTRLATFLVGERRRPMIRSKRTLRTKQTFGLDISTVLLICPTPAPSILARSGTFFIAFRGPQAQTNRPRGLFHFEPMPWSVQ
jgi:hypothetical protein